MQASRLLRVCVRVFCVAVGVEACAPAHGARGQGPLLPDVQSRLIANASELWPLEIVWERTRESQRPAAELLKLLKYAPMNVGELSPYKVRFLCDAGKYYQHIQRSSATISMVDGKEDVDLKNLHIVEDETSFDGKIGYMGNVVDYQLAAGGTPMMLKAPIAKLAHDAPPNQQQFNPDYLFWAGFMLPHTSQDLLNTPLQSLLLFEAQQRGADVIAAGTEQIGRESAYVVKLTTADRTVRFVLDPEKNYAVRRRTETMRDGRPLVDSECSEWTKVQPRDVWLPRQIRVTWNTWATIPGTSTKEPLLIEVFRLSDLKTGPIAANQFVLDYKVPGAMVKDAVVAGAERFVENNGYVDYRIPANPDDLERDIATILGSSAPSRRRIDLILTSNVVIVGVVVAVLMFRRRLQARGRSQAKGSH
jgi:hypothetical protein